MKIHWKIWVLIIALLSAFFFIAPWGYFSKGALILSIEKNTTASNAGLSSGMIINEINSMKINNQEDYSKAISEIFSKQVNNSEIKLAITTNKGQFIFLTTEIPSIVIGQPSLSKIKTGLDLSGGARALIKPLNATLSDSEISDLIAVTSERFNVYGIKDITIKPVKDLQGENYMLIEIAGATPNDLQNLVASQGVFEGKIGNQTVFTGGKDISHVERSGQQAGIEGCYSNQQGGEYCRFRFGITLTEEAAKKHAEITSKLSISSENPEYLSEKLDLYVDGNLMDSLFISKELKGRVTTQISVSGSGSGATRQDAIKQSQSEMKKLQTILITGSLPYKLEIVKLDTISPKLGRQFTKNLILLAAVVFILISFVLFIRYRKIKITSVVILTMFSEAFITLGIAALIKWNLDAASIAGIIAGMGTGVNDQIVIIDESISNKTLSLKERIKRAFFIILGAFFTIIAAMLPLFWAGAGMLKGFALTTIITVLAGILITRPAFAEILKKIQKE
jgi:preprotein translocase subunit SecD